ncbi:MAG TPA: sigma-54 dependent transcriptional regulator [Bryobacteraceae bacterium]|nr:sigma-54 dependent transcriptional regulator [Bryobacteraceae bacterium]
MVARRIILLNGDSKACASQTCDKLARHLTELSNTDALDVGAPATLDAATGPAGLVLLRFSAIDTVLELLPKVRDRWAPAAVIGVFCDPASAIVDKRLAAVLCSFDDFVFCPFRPLEVNERVRRLCPAQEKSCGDARAIREGLKLDFLVGESRPFLELLEKLPALAASDASVMITGETGAGKELFARAIHYSSLRASRGFVPVNCGALPDHLFENELFGHARGAFTGAVSAEKGLVSVANGGTLLLDEVDALSLAAQVKLLRFLQDREYRPLGSAQTLTADVRIIAASNADLRRKVRAGEMREDLYHRLHILSLHLPSLAERRDDIPLLAQSILARYAGQYSRPAMTFAPGVLRRLGERAWPGNVRELEGMIHRGVVMARGQVLRFEDLGIETESRPEDSASSLRQQKSLRIAEFERVYVQEALARASGNVSRAAREVGKDRRTFQRLMRKHAVERVCG